MAETRQETVIEQKESDLIRCPNCGADFVILYKNIRVEQAKITWDARDPEIAEAKRAVIKEVVEWGNEQCPHKTYPLEIRSKRFCELCWKTFLKEKGIDD